MCELTINGELTTDKNNDIQALWSVRINNGEVKLEDLYNSLCDLMEVMQKQIERGGGDTLLVPSEEKDINIDDIDISGFFGKN